MNASVSRPPAVLLGGINLVRTLGAAGIPVVLVTTDGGNPALASRYVTRRVLVPAASGDAALVAALVALGRELGDAAPLFYGGDDALQLVTARQGELGRHFRLLANDPALGRALLEKDLFTALMALHGLPVPRSFSWDEAEAIATPLIVKPVRKTAWHDSRVFQQLLGGKGKARVYPHGAALHADPLAAALKDELLVQEYVEGGDAQLLSYNAFADEHGRVLASFCGRKLRTYPAATGESSFVELYHDPELTQLGATVVATLGLRGPCKIDLKRDARTGRLVVMEINARYSLWNYLGAVNGLNLLEVAYDYLTGGRRPGATTYATAAVWLKPDLDYQAFRELHQRGELSLFGWVGSITRRRTVQDLFAWDDPGPFVRSVGLRLGARLGRWRATP